jgi:hypothetical protein
MRRRTALLAATTICLAIGALMTAFAQTKSLKDQILGTWIIVSNVVERPDGTKVDQFGPNPKGILIFASDGHFALVNTRPDLPKLASAKLGKGTPDENKAIVEGSLAYYGTYSVSDADKMITVIVEGSTYANQIGTVQKRLITSITAEEMKFTNPASTSGGSIQLVLKRANRPTSVK